MDIVRIFNSDKPKIAAMLYDGDEEDIFTQLLDQWYDRSYLTQFFLDNIDDLNGYYKLSIADAVANILDEISVFEEELLKIDQDADFDMEKLFEKYHKHEFAIRKKGENFRKARPHLKNPMIRLYAIEIEDGHIITGGCIKLTEKLNEKTKKIVERQLEMAQDFINSNKIVSLIDL